MNARKQPILLALLLAAFAATAGAEQTEKTSKAPVAADAPLTAEIGKPFRDFTLRDVASEDGRTVKLSDFRDKKAFVGIFMANRCGATWAYEEKIAHLLKDYADKDVEIFAIHSNYEESNREILDALEQRGLIDLPVLDDKKTQALADYMKADCTPVFFIVDKKGMLRYKGAFDRFGRDSTPYLRPALDAVLADEKVATPLTRALGCGIKRRVRASR